MAKVIAPLFSRSASGPLAGALTIQPLPTGHVIRAMPRLRLGFAASMPTPQQTAQRAAYAAACAAWQALTPEQQDAYDAPAERLGWTGFNLYVSEYLAAPAPVEGTIWDAGATTWDAGATVWDT